MPTPERKLTEDNRGADFARLLVRHDRALLRYILTLVPRRDDAEEVLQRTAAVLWEKFGEFDFERAFLPWALRFAYFEVLNFRKEFARSRLVFREEVLHSLADTHDEQSELYEAQRVALQQCLGEIGPAGLALLRRRYCDAETIAALAEETGKSAKSLYRRLDRLRDIIAECVERRLAGESI